MCILLRRLHLLPVFCRVRSAARGLDRLARACLSLFEFETDSGRPPASVTVWFNVARLVRSGLQSTKMALLLFTQNSCAHF